MNTSIIKSTRSVPQTLNINNSQRRKNRNRNKKKNSNRQGQLVSRPNGNVNIQPYIPLYRQVNSSSDAGHIGSLARSLVDPFEYSACIPDGSTGSGCFSVKEIQQIGTGTAGGCCGFYAGNLPQAQYYLDTGKVSATPTVTGNYVQATSFSAINSQYGKVRMISAGIKVTFIGNTTNDQGIILVGQAGANLSAGSFNALSLGSAASLMQYYKTYPLRSGAFITWRPNDEDDMMNYTATSSALQAVSNGFNEPFICVIVYGGYATAGTTIGQVEFVANYEGQYALQTFISGGLSERYNRPIVSDWYSKLRTATRYVEPISAFVLSTILSGEKKRSRGPQIEMLQ